MLARMPEAIETFFSEKKKKKVADIPWSLLIYICKP